MLRTIQNFIHIMTNLRRSLHLIRKRLLLWWKLNSGDLHSLTGLSVIEEAQKSRTTTNLLLIVFWGNRYLHMSHDVQDLLFQHLGHKTCSLCMRQTARPRLSSDSE